MVQIQPRADVVDQFGQLRTHFFLAGLHYFAAGLLAVFVDVAGRMMLLRKRKGRVFVEGNDLVMKSKHRFPKTIVAAIRDAS